MLRRGSARPARTAHFLGYRQIGLDDAVARFRMAVAAADGGGGCGEERFDLIHSVSPFERFPPPRSMRRVCGPCQRTASRLPLQLPATVRAGASINTRVRGSILNAVFCRGPA